MPKLIRNWDELFKEKSKDGKYKIYVEDSGYCAWIMPVEETDETRNDYFKHHVYLSTHTFYKSNYKKSTELLQKFGFDVEIDNWDKEE